MANLLWGKDFKNFPILGGTANLPIGNLKAKSTVVLGKV
jgi:hypothetical protein